MTKRSSENPSFNRSKFKKGIKFQNSNLSPMPVGCFLMLDSSLNFGRLDFEL